MPARRIPEEYHLPQNRRGQLPRENTQGYFVLKAIPKDEFVTTSEVFRRTFNYDISRREVQQWMCYLKKRGLIERRPAMNRTTEMEQRRLE